MRSTESLINIAPDLVQALAEIEGVAKDGANPAFKAGGKPSLYTTLGAVIGASREILAKHNLGLMQFPGALLDGTLTLETVIIHKSGEWVSGDFQIALGKVDPQGVGSALTYARRYAQKSALNIPDADDDAEAATDRNRPAAANKPQPASTKTTFAKTANTPLEVFIAAMKMNKTVTAVDAWAAREANNIMEKLKGREQDQMQSAYEEWRNECAARVEPQSDTPFDDDLSVMNDERAA